MSIIRAGRNVGRVTDGHGSARRREAGAWLTGPAALPDLASLPRTLKNPKSMDCNSPRIGVRCVDGRPGVRPTQEGSMKASIRRRSRRVVVAALALFALVGGVAYATIGVSANGVINGCYKSQNGQLRVVDPGT